jgi:hypothetical protein
MQIPIDKNSTIMISLLNSRTRLLHKVGAKLNKENNYNIFYFGDDSWVEDYALNNNLNYLILNSKYSNNTTSINEELKEVFIDIYNKDRSIKYYLNESDAINLFQLWFNKISNYIEKNKINYILIEGTPAYELIAELVIQKNKKKVICLFPSPIVSDWTLAAKQSQWVELYKTNSSNKNKESFINEFKQSLDEPLKTKSYISIKPKISNKLKIIFLKKSINFYPLTRIIYLYVFRKIMAKIIPIMDDTIDKEYDYIIFLHKEPEKSVQNSASKFANQDQAIINFLKEYQNKKILIKDHPHAKGYRKISEITKWKNYGIDYTSTLSNAKALEITDNIVTFTGTIATEASFKGKNVFLLGRSFQEISKNINPIFINKYYKFNILKATDSYEYIEKLADSAFQGIVTDEVSRPECLKLSNIKRISDGIKSIICI